jgi:DNA-directed RNA polymerase subunit RPC12/RpoP
MKTQQAYEQYQLYAQSQYEYYQTLTWVLFTLFVIAPIMMFLIYLGVLFYTRPRCPECGSRKLSLGLRSKKETSITMTEQVTICNHCGHIF